jgi:outer membrane beta-barrel protein
MESRVRILFLKLLLASCILPGVCSGTVFAADETTTNETNTNAKDAKKPNAETVDTNDTTEGVVLTPAIREDVKNIKLEQGTDQVIQPKIKRRKVISLNDVESEDIEFGPYGGLLSTEDFGTNAVAGVRLGYHISEYLFTEFSAAVSKAGETSYERLSGGAKLLTSQERKLKYYEISVGFNILPGESFVGKWLAYNTAFYIIGGAGITHFAGDDHFTLSYGAGYRFMATDWLAAHFDVRDHMFNMDLLGAKKTTNNLETQLGITIYY